MSSTMSYAATIGECATVAIGTYFHKWLKHEPGVREDQDPEHLHQMRVGLRRLRTALQCFAPILPNCQFLQEKRLGKIARSLGKVRDLDVLRAELQTNYFPLLPCCEQEQLTQCLAAWDKQRQKNFVELLTFLDSKFYQNTRQAFVEWAATPQFRETAAFAVSEAIPSLVLPIVSQLLLHPGWLVNYTKTQTDSALHVLMDGGEALHDLRKQCKRTRYQLECFQEFYPQDLRSNVRQLQNAQDILGFMRDRVVLTAALPKKRAVQLPVLAEIMEQHQAEDWQTWNCLQRTYLNPYYQRSLYQRLIACTA